MSNKKLCRKIGNLHRRLAIGHPLLRLAPIRVPVYQALLGAAAVFLLLVATEHPSPAKTLRALPTPLVRPTPTPPDSYEVTHKPLPTCGSEATMPRDRTSR